MPTPGSAASQFQQRLRNILRGRRAMRSQAPPWQRQHRLLRAQQLVARARARDELEKVKKMVEELDVVQPQVLIEAIIMDVSLTDNRSLGLTCCNRKPSWCQYPHGQWCQQRWRRSKPVRCGHQLPGQCHRQSGRRFSLLRTAGTQLGTAIRAVETDSFGRFFPVRRSSQPAEPAELFAVNPPFPSSSGADFTGVSRVSIDQSTSASRCASFH